MSPASAAASPGALVAHRFAASLRRLIRVINLQAEALQDACKTAIFISLAPPPRLVPAYALARAPRRGRSCSRLV
jgi:hypothetical protein